MGKEAIKERIKFYTELLKLLWILLIALGGGLSSLFLKGINSGKEILIILTGIILFVLVIVGVLKMIRDINKLLRTLEDLDD